MHKFLLLILNYWLMISIKNVFISKIIEKNSTSRIFLDGALCPSFSIKSDEAPLAGHIYLYISTRDELLLCSKEGNYFYFKKFTHFNMLKLKDRQGILQILCKVTDMVDSMKYASSPKKLNRIFSATNNPQMIQALIDEDFPDMLKSVFGTDSVLSLKIAKALLEDIETGVNIFKPSTDDLKKSKVLLLA